MYYGQSANEHAKWMDLLAHPVIDSPNGRLTNQPHPPIERQVIDQLTGPLTKPTCTHTHTHTHTPHIPNTLRVLRKPSADADRVCARVCVHICCRYLHARKIIHRDIKGANVLVSDAGVYVWTFSVKAASLCTHRRTVKETSLWDPPPYLAVRRRVYATGATLSIQSALQHSILRIPSSAYTMSWSRAFCGPFPKMGANHHRRTDAYGSL